MKVHPQVAAATALRFRATQAQVEADPIAQLLATRAAMVAAVPDECGPPPPLAHVSDVDADGVRAGCIGPGSAHPPFAYQILIYPVVDPSRSSASYRSLGRYGLDAETMALSGRCSCRPAWTTRTRTSRRSPPTSPACRPR